MQTILVSDKEDINENSNLKISRIQSGLQEIKEEKLEKSSITLENEKPTIVVKSPFQINSQNHSGMKIVMKKPQSVLINSKQTTLVKRLGNTTIRTMKSVPLKKISMEVMDALQKNQQVQKSSFQHTSMIDDQKVQQNLPSNEQFYIKQLEDQNREMKKMLLESRREAAQIQMRMHKLTNQINAVLTKCIPISKTRPYPAMKHQSQATLIRSSLPEATVSNSSKQYFKVVQRNIPMTTTGTLNVSLVMPAFPLKSLDTFKRLETDLTNRDFFDHVVKRLLSINKRNFTNPTHLLNSVLQSTVSIEFLQKFNWEILPISENVLNTGGGFKTFLRFRNVFHRVCNALMQINFGKNIEISIIESFLKAKCNKKGSNSQNAIIRKEIETKIPPPSNSIKYIKNTEVMKKEKKEEELKWLDEQDSDSDSNDCMDIESSNNLDCDENSNGKSEADGDGVEFLFC